MNVLGQCSELESTIQANAYFVRQTALRATRCESFAFAHISRALHVEHIRAIAARGQLAIPADAAADLAWASAHAAAILYVRAQGQTPDPAVINGLREQAMAAIFKSTVEKRK